MLASMSGTDPRADTPLNGSDLRVSELPTGTVTLLLADVEGSTRLWQTQPEEMTAAVARLDRSVCEVIAGHDGVRPVEQGEGDSFVVAFARASNAVACALALQHAPLAPIRLRIGVHTGEVQLRDEGNYIGPTVNRTARLRDLAHGGQTVLSGTTEDLVLDRLPADAWLTVLGTHQLRDLPRLERVVQLCHPDLRVQFPPLRAPDTVVAQHLPAQFTIKDEIYQHKNFSREKVHVLARLDASKLDYTKPNIHRTDRDFAVAWSKMYGKGRVFYATFGHAAETWDDPRIQKLYLEALKWALR